MTRLKTALPVVGAMLGLLWAPLSAQQPNPARGGISGTVLDAETLRPLQGVTVSLDVDGSAAFPGIDGSPFLTLGRTTISNAEGAYRFESLPPARYRIRITLLGYQPATVGVELRGSADSRVSVGLTVQPIVLESVDVLGVSAGGSYGRDVSREREIGGSRVEAARARQQAHLSTDVLGLTHADVLESVTLG